MRNVAVVAAAACALACSYKSAGETDTATATPAAQVAPAGEVLSAAVIRLERTACFHSCPEYSVAVAADGEVRYNGLRNVGDPGVHTARIPAESAAVLFRFADSVHFESLVGQYTHGTRGCEPYIADLPGVIVTVVRSRGGVRVEGDQGCPSTPPALMNLATMIDHMAGVEQWTRVK